jgi:hypothetical protein
MPASLPQVVYVCLRSCHDTIGTPARRAAGLRCRDTAVWRSMGELVRMANIKSFDPVNFACFRHSSIAACAIGPIETSRFDLGVLGLPSFPLYEASSTLKHPTSGLACHVRLTHWRALPEGINLPRLCACAAEEECCSDFSAHASQPRAQPGGCARSQRTCGADRGPRDRNCHA